LFGNSAQSGQYILSNTNNKIWKPIVKKYSDGKVKRTLKKGLKGLEMVKRERHKIIKIDISLFIQL